MRRCCSVAPSPSWRWSLQVLHDRALAGQLARVRAISTSTQCTPGSTSITSIGASTSLRGWWRSCSQTVSPRPARAVPGCSADAQAQALTAQRTVRPGEGALHRHHRRASAGPRRVRRAAPGRWRRASARRRGLAGVWPIGCSVQPAPASGGASQPGCVRLGSPSQTSAGGGGRCRKDSALRGIQRPRRCGCGRTGCRRGRCPWLQASRRFGRARTKPVRAMSRARASPPVSAMQPWSSRSTASGASDSISCR